MGDDFLGLLVRANLAASAAILLALAIRGPVARLFGARAAYALWLVAPLAAAANLAPARTVWLEAPAEPGVAAPATFAQVAAGVSGGFVDTPIDPGPSLFPLWLVGVAAWLAFLVWRQARFDRALGRLTPEAGLFRAEARGLGPVVVGTLRPRIVLPADFETRFSPAEREVVIAHERTHLRCGDHLVNGLVAAIQCLCWFNPLVHVAAHRLRQDQELACDAAVIARYPQAKKSYAEAMLKTQLAPLALPLGCHWPAGGARPLKQRIAMLKSPPGELRRAAGLVLVAALSLGGGLAAWAAQPARVEYVRTVARLEPAVAAAPEAAPVARTRPTEPDEPRAPRPSGQSLVAALNEGESAAALALIEAGADVDHHTPGDGTPLIEAVRHDDFRAVRALLEHGADVNKAAPGDGNPLIVAAAAGKRRMAALLVEAGADVNAFVPGDETPLINASRTGDLALVRYLVEQGADVKREVPAYSWRTPTRSPLSVASDPRIVAYLKSRGARP